MTASTIEIPLAREERLLWAGAPRRGLVLRASDAFTIPFSLVWSAVAVLFEARAVRDGATFVVLWGVPFLAAAAYVTVGRFVADAVRRARTTYRVTTDRVLILRAPRGLLRARALSLPLRALGEPTLHERADGSGTIVFGPPAAAGTVLLGVPWPGAPEARAFDQIPDARRVYEVVCEARRAAAAKAAASAAASAAANA